MKTIPAVSGYSNRILTDPALWERLQACSLDDVDSALPFTQRLARDNGWSYEFARRSVNEYKRFIYLACVSPNEVTPSDEVDQVWHLHLAYSHHYWDEFCPNVLKKILHHGPTKGGASEDERFEQQYDNTLKLYDQEFDAPPPGDIWPPRTVRFGSAASYRRISVERNAVLDRSELGRFTVVVLGCVLAALAWTAAMAALDAWVLLLFGNLVPFAIIASAYDRLLGRRSRQKNGNHAGTGCGAGGYVTGGGCGSSGGEGGSSCGGGGGGCGGGGD